MVSCRNVCCASLILSVCLSLGFLRIVRAHSHSEICRGTHDTCVGGSSGAEGRDQLTRVSSVLARILSTQSVHRAAYLSSFVTALASLAGLVLLPLPQRLSAELLCALLAFAAGALLADTLMHLLPHAYDHHAHETGQVVLAGVAAFFILDRIVANFVHTHHGHGSHSYDSWSRRDHFDRMMPSERQNSNPIDAPDTVESSNDQGQLRHSDGYRASKGSSRTAKRRRRLSSTEYSSSTSSASSTSGAHLRTNLLMLCPTPTALSAAYMNLAADALHNFCDGLTIGAAYKLSTAAGLSTTLAVFLHEVPQELGDYMLLLRGGFSKKTALAANLLCGLASLAGTFASLNAADAFRGAAHVVLPFCAGGLLYMTIATVLPELGDAVFAQRHQATSTTLLRIACVALCGYAGIYVVQLIEGVAHDLH